MGVDFLCPFRLGESDRTQNLTVLFESYPYMAVPLAKGFGWLVQFDVAGHETGLGFPAPKGAILSMRFTV